MATKAAKQVAQQAAAQPKSSKLHASKPIEHTKTLCSTGKHIKVTTIE